MKKFRSELETKTRSKLDALDEQILLNSSDGRRYFNRGKYLAKIEASEFALDDLNEAIAKGYARYLAAGRAGLAVKDRDAIKAIKEKRPEALPKLLE